MRSSQRRGFTWAALLGLLALALNALVPVHLAFDLADALALRQIAGTKHRDGERHLLALLIGHRETPAKPADHGTDHRNACPVCSSLGTLAGFAPAAAIELPLAPPAAMPAAPPVLANEPAGIFPAYRSRAPPAA